MKRLLCSVWAIGCLALGCVDPTTSETGNGAEQPAQPEQLVLRVDAEAATHPISPLIYGINPFNGYRCDDPSLRFGACRLGGNRWTAYNWENNLSNAGRDWCFQNDDHLSPDDDPTDDVFPTPGLAATGILAPAGAVGAAAMLTIPIVDHVAGAHTGGSGPPECTGDVRDRPDYLSTLFKQNVAARDGVPSSSPDLDDDFVYQTEFVALVREQAAGTRVIFSLDNEPELWDENHPEVHPDPVRYTELADRSVEFASAVRAVWPGAEISGYAGAGYMGVRDLWGAPDAEDLGEFADYYLDVMRVVGEATGVRLIDYFDVHWYPEINVGGDRLTTRSVSDEMVAARVQAPRSLWDPTFVEDSWLMDLSRGPLRLLPWLQEKIDEHYPGTRLAVTEWHYGAGQHISGGLAVADVLGVFGREGVGLATLWPHSNDEPYVKAAFRVFRNFDGNGSAFGDVSVHAESNDDAAAAIYASEDSADPERLVLVVINRSADQQPARIELVHRLDFRSASVFTLTEAGPNLQPAAPLTADTANTFEYPMPGHSVSVLIPSP